MPRTGFQASFSPLPPVVTLGFSVSNQQREMQHRKSYFTIQRNMDVYFQTADVFFVFFLQRLLALYVLQSVKKMNRKQTLALKSKRLVKHLKTKDCSSRSSLYKQHKWHITIPAFMDKKKKKNHPRNTDSQCAWVSLRSIPPFINHWKTKRDSSENLLCPDGGLC